MVGLYIIYVRFIVNMRMIMYYIYFYDNNILIFIKDVNIL